MPSILHSAFRGELVEPEAHFARRTGRPYEPAFKLLASIRAVRDASATLSKRPGKLGLVKRNCKNR